MRILFVIIFLFIQITSLCQQKVKIRVTYTNYYCGGARPTNEILNRYNKPQPLSNYKIKLVGKKDNIVKTNSLGCFVHRLTEGSYLIFLTEEKNNTIYLNYDPNCIKMAKTSFGKLIIEKEKTNYEVNLQFPCNPCEPKNKP